uniref:Uncharacterized protein n=1 Tax=Sinocyclocheilus rhinocerous TaxID=307959 RepID=A0A673MC37_9TELE
MSLIIHHEQNCGHSTIAAGTYFERGGGNKTGKQEFIYLGYNASRQWIKTRAAPTRDFFLKSIITMNVSGEIVKRYLNYLLINQCFLSQQKLFILLIANSGS